MLHLYDSTIPSGNAYKIHLLLSHLRLPYTTTSLDMYSSPPETKSPSFLALNPEGRIPLLVLESGTPLPESSAILCYLAEGTDFMPPAGEDGKEDRAQVLRWLFWEQCSHEPYVAVRRFHYYWGNYEGLHQQKRDEIMLRGQRAIDIMEEHLSGEGDRGRREWFVGGRFGVVDIALFAYTVYAESVGFRIGEGVRDWLKRVKEVEGHVPTKQDPLGKLPIGPTIRQVTYI